MYPAQTQRLVQPLSAWVSALLVLKAIASAPFLEHPIFLNLRSLHIPSDMDKINYPVQAVLKYPRQFRSASEHEDQLTEDAILNRHDPNQNFLFRSLQQYSLYSRLIGIPSVLLLPNSQQAYEPTLPYHQRSTNFQPSPAREAATRTMHQTHHDSGTPYPNGTVQQRPDQGDTEGQSVPTPRDRKKPTRSKSRHPSSKKPIKTEHQKCKEEIQEVLDSMFSGDGSDSISLLLCCGKSDRCQILLTRVSHSTEDVDKWHAIRKVWYTHKGGWRKLIPFFGVQEVGFAEVSTRNSLPGLYRN
jgi:hypothetical protein